MNTTAEATNITVRTISAALQEYAVLVNGKSIGTVRKFGALWEGQAAGNLFAETSRKAVIAKMVKVTQ